MRTLLPSLLLLGSLGAQTVHLVGPGGFPELDPAIAAASPGDILRVAPGTYSAFTLDKALTIEALPGGEVGIYGFVLTTRLRPPAGSTATISRLHFRNPWSTFISMTTRIERGTVFCEDCLFEAPPTNGVAALTVDNATAVLRGCTLVGNGIAALAAGMDNDGLQCNNAGVFASDCWFRGSDTVGDSLGNGGDGVQASSSVVHLVHCRVEGGRQRSCFANPPGRGIALAGTSRLWLADSTVSGGHALCSLGAVGGIGLQNGTAVPAQLARSTITGGAGTPNPAPAITGPTATAPLLGLGAASQPVLLGSPFTITYQTEPNWPIVVLLAGDLAQRNEPLVAQPVVLAGAAPPVLALLFGDALGAAVYQTNLPNHPSLRSARLFVGAVAGLSTPLQTSPPLGGVAR